jgi:hypothetical protein
MMPPSARDFRHHRPRLAASKNQEVHDEILNRRVRRVRRENSARTLVLAPVVFPGALRVPRGAMALSKHFRIHFREKCTVQTPHHLGRVVLFDYESQINFRRALRDHANLYILKDAEHLGGDSGCLP